MTWPNPEDYNEAVQWPEICFEDAELRLGQPELNALGVPKPVCGNFASVYRFSCEKRQVAVKCFLRNVYNQHQRYAHLSQFMAVNEINSIVDFEYLLKGMLVEGKWYPIVKMGWVDGLTLDQFLRKQMYNRCQLDTFLTRFVEVVKELNGSGIAHGDLQHGNIMVKTDSVKLVDYDGIFVPAMLGEESNELGHGNYQHKDRESRHFNAGLDHFSAWIIFHTIHFLRLDPTLWQRHDGGDDALLFRRADFRAPENSRLMAELSRHPVPEIRERALLVRNLLSHPFEKVPPFDPAEERRLFNPQTVTVSLGTAESGAFPAVITDRQSRSTGELPQPAVRVSEPRPSWWPGVPQYTLAIGAPSEVLNDPKLKSGRLIKEDRIVGSRGVIFKISCADGDYAVKCFLKYLPDRKARYEAIARHDMGDATRFLVSFQYQAKGIFIENTWFPILKMPWVGNRTLENHVLAQLKFANKGELQRLLFAFRDLVDAIAASGIAHGDLEPGNIMINDKDRLKLVDYDAMYVPTIAALESCETGNPVFQHPSRTLQHFGPYLDNYPALIIDSVLSLMAMMPEEKVQSWESFIRQLKPSNSWHPKSDSDTAIARVGRQIKEMGKYRIDQVPSLKSSRSL